MKKIQKQKRLASAKLKKFIEPINPPAKPKIEKPIIPIKRTRTIFPLTTNFNGWWFRSPKGLIGQLVDAGWKNSRGSVVYNLLYSEQEGFPQTLGNGTFTTETILMCNMTIHETKEEAKNATHNIPLTIRLLVPAE